MVLLRENWDKSIPLPPILRKPVATFSFLGAKSVIGSPEGECLTRGVSEGERSNKRMAKKAARPIRAWVWSGGLAV